MFTSLLYLLGNHLDILERLRQHLLYKLHPLYPRAPTVIEHVLHFENEHGPEFSAAEPRQKEGGRERCIYAPGKNPPSHQNEMTDCTSPIKKS
jgi:hypothetical protein